MVLSAKRTMPITATQVLGFAFPRSAATARQANPLLGYFSDRSRPFQITPNILCPIGTTFAVLRSSIGPGSLSWMPTCSGQRAIAGSIASAGAARADRETIWSILAIAQRSLRLRPAVARGARTSVSARFDVPLHT